MKLSHKKLIIVSGLVWLAIGVYLLQLGLGLLIGSLQSTQESHLPVIKFLSHYIGGVEVAALLLVVAALYIGYFKGRFILGKSAKRGVARIRTFSDPAPLKNIYEPKYYVLIGLMVGLGISIKFLGLSNDVRGFVDVIIGSALINGAMVYFRLAQETKASEET